MKVRTGRVLRGAAAVALCLCMALCSTAFADDLDDAWSLDEQLSGEKDAVQKEQEAMKSELKTLISGLKELSGILYKRQLALKEEEEKFADAKVDENDRYLCMKKRIKFMYEDGQEKYLWQLIFDSRNMSELLNKVEYVSAISTYDRDMLEALADVVKDSKSREESLRKEYRRIAGLQAEMSDRLRKLKSLIKKSDEELAQIDEELARNEELIYELMARAEEEENRTQYMQESYSCPDGSESYYTGEGFAHPCPGAPISSYFGYRDFDNSFHKGVDFAVPEWTPTYAAESGIVVIAGWSYSAGNWIVINHGGGLVTKYMHHVSLCVEEGQFVERGQQIGYVGSTGYSTGPHLHFQVEVDSVAVDPMGYL